jgi:protein phosphatase
VDELMSIGDFSGRSGLSPKRLRSYAASGLLTPAAVDPDTAYRFYSPGQLRDARLIDALRRAGIPLAEISLLLRDRRPTRVADWAERLRYDADRRHEALDLALALLGPDHTPTTEIRGTGRTAMPYLQCAGQTHVGHVRENNEDAIVTGTQLVAVADGMGRHAGGELASRLATALIAASFAGSSLDLVEDGVLAVVHVGDTRAYLASEGSLHRLTEDHTVTAELVRDGELTEAAVDALLDLGLARGGDDNLSVVVADVCA